MWTVSASCSGIGSEKNRQPTSQLAYLSKGSQNTSHSSCWYSNYRHLTYQLAILNLSLCRYAVGMVISKPRWVSSILYISPVLGSPQDMEHQTQEFSWHSISSHQQILRCHTHHQADGQYLSLGIRFGCTTCQAQRPAGLPSIQWEQHQSWRPDYRWWSIISGTVGGKVGDC